MEDYIIEYGTDATSDWPDGRTSIFAQVIYRDEEGRTFGLPLEVHGDSITGQVDNVLPWLPKEE